MKNTFLVLFTVLLFSSFTTPKSYDLVIYGGTSAGVIAGYTAKKYHLKVLLISPDKHIGGLSAGGLGATDIGNKSAVTGVALDFYRRLGNFYNKLESWNFEPSKAEIVFNQYVHESGLTVWKQTHLQSVTKVGTNITQIIVNDGIKNIAVSADYFIDATYEGDLMAMAGVSYTVGREANAKYNETLNGFRLADHHQFKATISPYIIPGDSSSGILSEISTAQVRENGSGDSEIQAYNFRLCLTQNKDNFIPITTPNNYNRSRYELLARYIKAEEIKDLRKLLLIKAVGSGKTDINNQGAFSTDFIGGNKNYPEADQNTRKQIWKEHERYTKGLLYFLGNDLAVPSELRSQMLSWGYPKDEFIDNGGFPHQLYVREARRMVGETVITEHHCRGEVKDTDGVGLAAYMMDSHNCQRLIVDGKVMNEGNVNKGVPSPFPISYRAIRPQKQECTNLLVPICMSATHIAYGSIRMEPVFMVLAQSAAVAVAISQKTRKSLHDIDVVSLQKELTQNPYANGKNPYTLIDEDAVILSDDVIKKSTIWGKYDKTYFYSDGKKEVKLTYPVKVNEDGMYSVYVYRAWIEDSTPKSKKVSVELYVDNTKQLNIGTFAVSDSYETHGWHKIDNVKLKKNKAYSIVLFSEKDGGVVALDALLLVKN